MLEDGGHQVESLFFDNPVGTRSALADVVRSPWNSTAASRAVDAARTVRPDVVHVHNTWFSLSPAVFPALAEAGFPTVATIHNYRPLCVNAMLYRNEGICVDCVGTLPWRGVLYGCYRGSRAQSAAVALTTATHRLRRTLTRDVDVVVALTGFAKDLLVEAGVDPASIVVKPNVGRDPGKRPAPPSESDVILYVGRITEEKGVAHLVDAWRSRTPSGLRLVVVGEGPDADRVRSRAGERTEFAGRVQAAGVQEMMLGARALVLPSRWYEGLPMVLVEAMGAGLPTVVPDHGALPDTAGAGGITFQSGRVESLAEALSAVEDDDRVDRLGAASRDTFEQNHSVEVGLAALERIYARAMDRPKGSTGP